MLLRPLSVVYLWQEECEATCRKHFFVRLMDLSEVRSPFTKAFSRLAKFLRRAQARSLTFLALPMRPMVIGGTALHTILRARE